MKKIIPLNLLFIMLSFCNVFAQQLEIEGDAYIQDSLGIGTSIPISRLQVGDLVGPAGNNYITVGSAGGNTSISGLKLRHFNDEFGFTIQSSDLVGSQGLNILRHINSATGLSDMFIDLSGNVGIGNASPNYRLDVNGNANFDGDVYVSEDLGIGTEIPEADIHTYSEGGGSDVILEYVNTSGVSRIEFKRAHTGGTIVSNGDNIGIIDFFAHDGTDYLLTSRIRSKIDGTPGTSDMPSRLFFETTPDGSDVPVERMTIKSSGNVGIGNPSPSDKLDVEGITRSFGVRTRTGLSGSYGGNVYNMNWTGSGADLWIDATNVGTIQTTSDRRLKSDIESNTSDALSRVMALEPVTYKYKTIEGTIFKGNDQIIEGFIADELQEVIPSAINGEKDALTSDGTIQPQTVNVLPIVSVLTKAIQEQQEIISDLKSELEEIKALLKN